MKKLIILMVSFQLFQLGYSTSCHFRGYDKENGKVFYRVKIDGRHIIKEKEMLKVDVKTFKELDRRGLAVDKNNLYYDGNIVHGIDAKSVEVVKIDNKNPEIEYVDMGDGEPLFWRFTSTGAHCFRPYVFEIKDKNGSYLIKDIRAGMYEIVE